MKFLFDIFPILLFFIAFKFFGIYVATGVAMAASFLQILFTWFTKKEITFTLWVNLIVITLFGGLTLLFHNELFIKWKPTIIYTIFAATLFGAEVFFKKNLIRMLLHSTLVLPEAVLKKLNTVWILFFVSVAALNLFVAYSFSTETWVNFKLFGLISLTLLFVLGQSLWLSRYIKPPENI